MITSHETENDFTNFFTALKELAIDLDIEFDSRYFMQDAQRSCFNATKTVFPDSTVLMCYFHVSQNISKHKHLMKDQSKYNDLKKDIIEIHKSLDMESYQDLKTSLLTNGQKKKQLFTNI